VQSSKQTCVTLDDFIKSKGSDPKNSIGSITLDGVTGKTFSSSGLLGVVYTAIFVNGGFGYIIESGFGDTVTEVKNDVVLKKLLDTFNF
ncbi:hypothetical protein HY844_02435, partial [Candidatus Berkelbacteria bacterium]|nr:hypothetical protein [Candidatus Berkelbacteria bacterium]